MRETQEKVALCHSIMELLVKKRVITVREAQEATELLKVKYNTKDSDRAA